MSRSSLSVPALVVVLVSCFLLPGAALSQTSRDEQEDADSPEPVADSLVTPPAGDPGHSALAPQARAVQTDGEIELDGRLSEAAWEEAPAVTRFIQREPEEGVSASQRTEVRFLYDEETLYVGARMYDEEGREGVTSRLVRRDAHTSADYLEITFDTFLDHLGQTRFRINPSGARADAYGPGGSNLDDSWDPVWEAETRVHDDGWSAELAIPFSQLRFEGGGEQTWGLQLVRHVNRLNEYAWWSFYRRDQQGGPSRFGHLTGIRTAGASTGRVELLPYAVTQLATVPEAAEANPFEEAREYTTRVGADLQYLVSSELTLNATVNPDFGQVEVDPAVVNLSAFETFFPEKREFFVRNRGLFDFGSFWCFTCSNTSSLDMLFTRRIGRAPQGGSLARAAGEFADVPDNTTILGAAKLTGRTRGGTSIGVLAALTDREHARVLGTDGGRFDQEVEPLSGYFVGRVTQDLNDGALQVGAMATSVVRNFDDPALGDRLAAHSESFGVDAEWWWGDRTYHWLFSGAVTNVSGSPAAILRLQESSARYFQRPDREHGSNGLFTDRLDPGLESMRGYGLYSRIAKDAGRWAWEAAVNVRSPGFENNDLAFLTRTDFIYMLANVQQRFTDVTPLYRYLQWNVGAQQELNFDGDLVGRQFHAGVFTETPFYWNVNLFGLYRPRTLNDRRTRGGPVVEDPASAFTALFVGTDSRKLVSLGLNPTWAWNEEGVSDWGLGVDVTLRPASNVSLSLGPRFNHSESSAQYVTAVDDPTRPEFFGRRYVFADLEQETFSVSTRLNWTFTPEMSLELFAQPFVSANRFSRFKEFAAPRRLDKTVYGEDAGTVSREDGSYVIDPDGQGPAEAFTVADPDFNFRSLRGNLVYRWEYLPGSTLFLVWTQDRSATAADGDFRFGRDFDSLFAADAENVFLVKATYWLGI